MWVLLVLICATFATQEDPKVLVFRKNQLSKGEKITSPQLKCLNCDKKSQNIVDTIQCDRDGVYWNCKSVLPVTHKLDNVSIVCEGYIGKDHRKHIYQNSCKLTYTLSHTFGHVQKPTISRIFCKGALEGPNCELTYTFNYMPNRTYVSHAKQTRLHLKTFV